MIQARKRLVVAALIATVILGCGPRARSKMQVFPVSGKLTVAGKPVKGLVVTLTPKTPLADSRHVPAGVVGPDGLFIIQTYEPGDGAPAGEYGLIVGAVVEMSSTAPGVSDEVQQILKKYESVEPGRKTPVAKPVTEIVVKEGINLLEPIDLK